MKSHIGWQLNVIKRGQCFTCLHGLSSWGRSIHLFGGKLWTPATETLSTLERWTAYYPNEMFRVRYSGKSVFSCPPCWARGSLRCAVVLPFIEMDPLPRILTQTRQWRCHAGAASGLNERKTQAFQAQYCRRDYHISHLHRISNTLGGVNWTNMFSGRTHLR